MNRPKLLLFVLCLSLPLMAETCQPDCRNTSINIDSKKFYCTESLTTKGCNVGKVELLLDIDTQCREAEKIDITCSTDLQMKTRESGEKFLQTLIDTKPFTLEDGKNRSKFFMSWSRLNDAARDIEVKHAVCYIAGKKPPAPDTRTKVAPPPSKQPRMQPASNVSSSQETYELELLKEQNRAKELEIKKLELQIKLKELER